MAGVLALDNRLTADSPNVCCGWPPSSLRPRNVSWGWRPSGSSVGRLAPA